MYKIDRRGGVQKLFSRNIPKNSIYVTFFNSNSPNRTQSHIGLIINKIPNIPYWTEFTEYGLRRAR